MSNQPTLASKLLENDIITLIPPVAGYEYAQDHLKTRQRIERMDVAKLILQGMAIAGRIDFGDPDKDFVRCWKIADAFLRCGESV